MCPDETVDGTPVTGAAFLPASEVSIVSYWDTVGMRGTDSNDLELHGVYVPERRTFRIGIDHRPGPRYDGPLYRGAAMLLVASYIPPSGRHRPGRHRRSRRASRREDAVL